MLFPLQVKKRFMLVFVPHFGNYTDQCKYTGNHTGIVGLMADLVGDGNPGRPHYLVPHIARRALSNEELQYLRYKGVFTVPPKEVCDILVRLYFLHVHPLLPVLDATTFLGQYIEHGYDKVNLQLLWSMIFMAAGFAEPEVLSQMGYSSRKALKRAAYSRAKVLYDTAYDDDQIALIQSVILMSHWNADIEDRFEAWHWINVAISMCQVAGLHSAPKNSTRKSPAFNEARERLCRRIWWQCVVRERWISMVKGRPLRVRLEDCDVAEATPEDLEYDLRQLPELVSSQYFPFNIKRISHLWAKQIKISVLLGDIIRQNMKSRALGPPQDQLERLLDLEHSDWDIPELEPVHSLERLCVYHVRLLYNATSIALWRPKILSNSSNTISGFGNQQAIEKARAAAVSSNTILEEIISWDLVKYLKSQTITALVPAMQIHLLDCKSSSTPVRMLGTNRLLLCMQLLTELKSTYWAAEFALRLFQRAHEKILQRQNRKNEALVPIPARHPALVTTDADTMHPTAPYHEQMTPQSLSSDEEMLLAGFDWEGYPEMKPFWE